MSPEGQIPRCLLRYLASEGAGFGLRKAKYHVDYYDICLEKANYHVFYYDIDVFQGSLGVDEGLATETQGPGALRERGRA